MQQLGYATSFAGKYMNNYGYGTNSTVDSLPQCLNSTMAWDTNHMRATCAQRVEHVPRGWQNWQALKGNSVYYNYTLSNNGVAETHGDNYEDDYLIDLVKNRTLDFLGSAIAAKKPFFATLAVPSAHEPADPAPQYADYAKDLVAPRTPNFNLVMGANGPRGDDARHWMVANVNGASGGIPMNDTVISFVDLLYRRRLATLQSVDDLVEALVNKVDAAGKLDETYFVYTADNGYHLGQFAIGLDKRQPYDTDVKVPFYARGPGIPKRSQITYGALISIDLAPTFLQWAQVDLETIAALGFDGQPMAKYIASGSSTARRDFLIEYNGENWDACATYLANDFPGVNWDKLDDGLNCGLRGPDSFLTEPFWKGGETWSSIQDSSNNTYNCVRSVAGGGAVGEAGEIAATAKSGNSTDEIYCEWASGEVEYYDLIADPWQMANLAPSMDSALQREYQAKLAGLVGCVGSAECSGSGIKKE
jgi:N-acetylglucosamine-6-sulfatase